MANILNMEYILSAARTRRDIAPSDLDPLGNYSKLVEDKTLIMAFQPAGTAQIVEAIRKLNPSPSTSTDGISIKLLKLIQTPIIPVIINLVNTTIITCYPEAIHTIKYKVF